MALLRFANQLAEIVQLLLAKSRWPFVMVRGSCSIALCICISPQSYLGPLWSRGSWYIRANFPAIKPIPARNNDIAAVCLGIDTECDYIRGVLEIATIRISV